MRGETTYAALNSLDEEYNNNSSNNNKKKKNKNKKCWVMAD